MTDAQRDTEDLRMATYAAMIDRLDQNIGRILVKLDDLGDREKTIVLFASDNGGSSEVVQRGDGPIGSMTRWASLKADWANVSNTPFRKYKNYSMEGGIATPLIVSWPNHIARPGGYEKTPGHFIDIMATFTDLARADYPKVWKDQPVTPMQGVSLRPLLQGLPLPQRPPIYWHWRKGKAIRVGSWKLVSHGGPWELYDLEADRTERQDLSASYPGVTAHLSGKWEAWSKEVER